MGTGSTPYEVTFGRKPFNFSTYLSRTSNVDAVEDTLQTRDEVFATIRKKLLKAQATMKHTTDTKRREIEYQIGDWVLVKLRPFRQKSVKGVQTVAGKLAKHFYGPFQVLNRVGPVAYRLQLPEGARIHLVFHCSLLKPFKGIPEHADTTPFPAQFINDQPVHTPLAILDHRRSSLEPHARWEVLVQWCGLSPDEATWED